MPKLTGGPLLGLQARNYRQGAAEVPAHIRGIHRGAEPCREHQACFVPLLASGMAFGILLSAPSDERPDAQVRECDRSA